MEKVSRNVCRNLLLIATCTLALGFTSAASADSPAEQALLAKARSLAASGHFDMAVQTWQQVLLESAASAWSPVASAATSWVKPARARCTATSAK